MNAFETTAIVEDASDLALRSPVSFPESREILNTYVQLACPARDRELGRKRFEEIGGEIHPKKK